MNGIPKLRIESLSWDADGGLHCPARPKHTSHAVDVTSAVKTILIGRDHDVTGIAPVR